MGFLNAGNGIPMSDYFIRWFWAGFAADAAFSLIDKITLCSPIYESIIGSLY